MELKESKDVDVLVGELKQSQHEDAVDALNPCPVCGGEAELISQLFSEYYVGCKDCNMQTGIQSKSGEAMERWNSLRSVTARAKRALTKLEGK